MINLGTKRFIYKYKTNGEWKIQEAKRKDKVIIQLVNKKTITGIIFQIGTKNLYLLTYPTLQGKNSSYLNLKTYKIKDIKTFAKYPKNSQRYIDKKLY